MITLQYSPLSPQSSLGLSLAQGQRSSGTKKTALLITDIPNYQLSPAAFISGKTQ